MMKLLALFVTSAAAAPNNLLDPQAAIYAQRELQYGPAARAECKERGLIDDASDYSGLTERLRCRAMMVDMAKNSDWTNRAKTAGIKAVVAGACDGMPGAPENWGAAGNECPVGCRNAFLSQWPDMEVLNAFDVASDDFCKSVEGTTFNADLSDEELVVDNQAGEHRCRCLADIGEAMGALDLATGRHLCNIGSPLLTAEACGLVNAASDVCEMYEISDADCRGQLTLAYMYNKDGQKVCPDDDDEE